MRRTYFVLAVGTIALGLIHVAATFRFFPHLTSGAVWFASGGLAIILTGALNLLLQPDRAELAVFDRGGLGDAP